MPTDDEHDDDLDTPPRGSRSELEGLRERSWRQRERIKALRAELDTARGTITDLTGRAEKAEGQVTALKAEHKAAIEQAEADKAGAIRGLERKAALASAGVDPDGQDVVLSAYDALGEGAPELAEWLKGEDLPKHVQVYLGDGGKGGSSHDPDAGTGGRAGSAGPRQSGFLAGASVADLKALKEQGQF